MRRRSIAALTLLAIAACGGGDGGGGEGVGTATGALAALPDPGGEVFATFTDWQRAAEVAGVELPGDRASGEEEIDFLIRISGGTGSTEGDLAGGAVPRAVVDFTEAIGETSLRDEAGIDVGDIHAFAELQTLPDGVVVLSGSFDTDAISDALGAEPDDDGFVVLGEEGERVFDAGGPLRGRIGRGVVVAPSSSRVVVAHTSELAEVATGDGTHLGDVAGLAALAAALDGEGAYAGFLSARGDDQDFEASATGIAEDGGRHVLLIAFAYDDAAGAEAHRDGLEAALAGEGSDIIDRLEDPVVEVRDGTVVLLRAVLAADVRPTLWVDLFSRADPLLQSPSRGEELVARLSRSSPSARRRRRGPRRW